MNQILLTSNDYNSYDKDDTKKIIMIFCIAIIIFAIVVTALKVYEIYKSKQVDTTSENPEVEITEQSDGQVIINANCKDGINYIIYTWNRTNENRVNLNGSTSFQRIVSMPYSKENILKVEVVSMNNIKSEIVKTFGMEVDEELPKIDALTVAGSKLSIDVSDNSGIDYIEYQWEGEEADKFYANDGENKTFNLQINIQRGTHKLSVRVVDIYGNEETMSRLVTGVNEPEILVLKYGNTVSIKATHDMGIKQISALINDKLYVFNESDPEYVKDTVVQREFPLEEGENTVKVIVHSYEKLSEDEDDSLNNYAFKTFVGYCTYDPNEE